MSGLRTIIGRAGTKEAKTILDRLGRSYEKQILRLDVAAAHADRSGAHGMAQDLRVANSKLSEAARDLFVAGKPGLTQDAASLEQLVLSTRQKAKPGMKLSKLVAAPSGKAPESVPDRLMALRHKLFEPAARLESLRDKLKIDPAKAGDSLNSWISKLRKGIADLFSLAGGVQSGRLGGPEAIAKVRMMRRDPDFKQAIAGAKALGPH